MKRYLEITIPADEQTQELLLPGLQELGCHGFLETPGALLCYVECTGWDGPAQSGFCDRIASLMRGAGIAAAPATREIPEENWNRKWEETLRPIQVGDRLVVIPSTSGDAEAWKDRVPIYIVPKMSFGTGYHESTRLTLRLLERHLRPGWSMLDVGTGTGILAIAAMKLGASSAEGIDIDEWSIANARDNVRTNGLEGRIRISSAPLQQFPDTSFHLLAANLTLNTILEFLGEFHRVLLPSGVVLLSGLFRTDREALVRRIAERSFRVIEEMQENEWLALAAQKLQ